MNLKFNYAIVSILLTIDERKMTMNKEDHQFFKQNGYLPLGNILTQAELAYFTQAFDRDHTQFADHWHRVGHHQTVNGDVLVTSPDFDQVIRHPKVMAPLQNLMSGPICFSEISLRHMSAYDGELHRSWHRDRGHWFSHPLRTDYLQLMVYLTDVDEITHCFSISPESAAEEILDRGSQLQRGGMVDLYGSAGTCVLFNVAVLHTATTRPTTAARKSIQVYYGHTNRPHLSEITYIPYAFGEITWSQKHEIFTVSLTGKQRSISKRPKIGQSYR